MRLLVLSLLLHRRTRGDSHLLLPLPSLLLLQVLLLLQQQRVLRN